MKYLLILGLLLSMSYAVGVEYSTHTESTDTEWIKQRPKKPK